MTIMARKGEKVFDPDGNLYATFAKDVHWGDRVSENQLIMASTGKPPPPHKIIPDWFAKRYQIIH
jgi:hypothetical protein